MPCYDMRKETDTNLLKKSFYTQTFSKYHHYVFGLRLDDNVSVMRSLSFIRFGNERRKKRHEDG